MEGEEDFLKTSISVSDFNQIYNMFCIKYGYQLIDVFSQKKLLKQNRIKIEYKMDKSTKVLIKIRWQRPDEMF